MLEALQHLPAVIRLLAYTSAAINTRTLQSAAGLKETVFRVRHGHEVTDSKGEYKWQIIKLLGGCIRLDKREERCSTSET
jgi:hypothetical protein